MIASIKNLRPGNMFIYGGEIVMIIHRVGGDYSFVFRGEVLSRLSWEFRYVEVIET